MFESFNFASCCRTVHYKYTTDSCWCVSIHGSSIKASAQLMVLEILNHTTALKQEWSHFGQVNMYPLTVDQNNHSYISTHQLGHIYWELFKNLDANDLYLKLIHHVAKNIEPKEAKQILVCCWTWVHGLDQNGSFICYLTLESYCRYYCVYWAEISVNL